MIFVDTSAWYASAVPNDPHHSAAAEYLATRIGDRLVTTDYVLDETLTLFRMRGAYERGLALGARILGGDLCHLEKITAADIESAFQLFSRYRDKGWSFTDCTSFVVMRRMSLTQAFAFDVHFEQFGAFQILPGR